MTKLITLEPTLETEREKTELELRLTMAQKKLLTTEQKDSLLAEITSLDSTVYVVSDGSYLAKKIISSYPCYNFVEDKSGSLTSIEILPKPEPLPPEPTT